MFGFNLLNKIKKSKKDTFDKKILTIENQIKLLEERWLNIGNREKAKRDLLHIWYFRLSWYLRYFTIDLKWERFKEWIDFSKAVNLYNFDRKLRALTLDATEKIEISIKSVIIDYIWNKYWEYWYLDKEIFFLENDKNKELYKKFMKKIKDIKKNSKSDYIKHFNKKYSNDNLPIWMLFQELSFWEVTTFYKLLKISNKKIISKKYWINNKDLWNWIFLINKIRNICAHHQKLWNSDYNILISNQSKKINSPNYKELKKIKSDFHNVSLIIKFMLNKINPNFNWKNDLEKLLNEERFKDINKKDMGF